MTLAINEFIRSMVNSIVLFISEVYKTMLLGPCISMVGRKKMDILMHRPNKGLDFMIELFEASKVKPFIDRCYPLSELPEALRYFGKGKVLGKVIITLEHNKKT